MRHLQSAPFPALIQEHASGLQFTLRFRLHHFLDLGKRTDGFAFALCSEWPSRRCSFSLGFRTLAAEGIFANRVIHDIEAVEKQRLVVLASERGTYFCRFSLSVYFLHEEKVVDFFYLAYVKVLPVYKALELAEIAYNSI